MSGASEVVLQDFVPGGQVLGELPDGKKVFVWGGLPGETVGIAVKKSKKKWAEALVTKVIVPSEARVMPRDPDSYLATSPWQIMNFAGENDAKKRLLREAFLQARIDLPDFQFVAGLKDYHYRNKMEYSFWADDNGLSLALYNRGTHQKIIVAGSSLAMQPIDAAARGLLAELNRLTIEGRQLKSLILRCNQKGEVAASLFVKDQKFPLVKLPADLQGLRVYFSNPKSPASVATKLLFELGYSQLSDTLLGKKFVYRPESFFQVNIEPYEFALESMKRLLDKNEQVIDMYAGVGTIGLSLGARMLVESDAESAHMARENAGSTAEVVESPAEKSLELIRNDSTVIFDPPRAGLHESVIDRLLAVKPPKIIYLSCNPATQARDIAHLEHTYSLEFFEGYNFFPRTPHSESLAMLTRK